MLNEPSVPATKDCAQPDKGWTDRDEARWPVPFWHIDTGMAAMLQLLTAVDEGLDALYFGIVPPAGAAVQGRVRVPENCEPIGAIAIGYDADIALWDPQRTATLSQANLHHGADYTPYEGFKVKGWPVTTILRGRVVVDQGTLTGAKGFGTYLPRGLSDYARA